MNSNRHVADNGDTVRFRHSPLIPVLLLLVAAGCGQGDKAQPGEAGSATPPIKPSISKALGPEAARMELAKLNKDYSPTEFVKSAANGDKLAIELSLAAGMEVNVKNENGMTALVAASAKGQKEIAAVLLAHKADVGSSAADGFTPLMLAVAKGNAELAILLIEGGALLHERVPVFQSAGWEDDILMFATKRGNARMVRLLLEAGANPYCHTGGGETAESMAKEMSSESDSDKKASAKVILQSIREFKQLIKPKLAGVMGKYAWPDTTNSTVELTGNGFYLERFSDSDGPPYLGTYPYRVHNDTVKVLTGINTAMAFGVVGQDLVNEKSGMRLKRVQTKMPNGSSETEGQHAKAHHTN